MPNSPSIAYDYGIRITVGELMRLRAEAQRLQAPGPDAVAGLFPGLYRSLFRGRGLDFEEVRAYQQGDDFRLLDWRVTARTGRPHTKVFREEREHTVHLLLDNGPTMQFGSRRAFKWVTAARVAAVIAWLAADNGDRVGGLVFGDGRRCHEQRPIAGSKGPVRLFRLLERAQSHGVGTGGLADALGRLRRHVRPGSLVVVLSDFKGLDASIREHLSYIAGHSDVALIFVHDPMERELPPPGRYPFTDGERTATLDTGNRALRDSHAALFAGHRDAVAATCRRYGLRFGEIGTEEDLVEGLRRALVRPVKEHPPKERRNG